ncbi:PP-loop family-domain-containing protein [Cadophora sp. MPI-SDFR-AT-0126]|nr:PP-loop family-domain-containing protein [Leotiomycetes sp. MPI-SDFR-AT-0126]
MGSANHIVRKAAFLQKTASSPRSISAIEFSKVWPGIWLKSREPGLGANLEPTIGLAISGGVDSMALAFLCSSMNESLSAENRVNFRAFVVDHGFRNGSDNEALAVSKSLETRGIPTQVLKIEWPSSLQAHALPNFESAARRYRFRTLGKACSEWGINSLFLAHHEDDQVETVMMRLMEGHRMGLTGIKDHSEIPECYGIHGVHESGRLDIDSFKGLTEYKPNYVEKPTHRTVDWKPQLTLESGGVRVYRPLLGFSKERLIATCKENNVEWFEDHTNKDRTLTKRNAIRHILSKYALPKALSKPALLDLSEKMRKQEQRRKEVLEQWLSNCCITSLDLQVGTAKVNFADLNQFKEHLSWPGERAGQTAAELLSRIMMLVSPHEHVPISSLHGAVSRLFPELSKGEPRTGSFTVCGLYFQSIQRDSPGADKPGHDRKPIWHISRQPFGSNEITKHVLTYSSSPQAPWSPWRLFDGRYWIRVKNNSSSTVLVQPLSPTQWPRFKQDLGQQRKRALKIMKQKAPDGVRYTLPSVVLRTKDGNSMEEDRVVALPTLGICSADSVERKEVECEVRYKKIYTAGLPIVGGHTPSNDT